LIEFVSFLQRGNFVTDSEKPGFKTHETLHIYKKPSMTFLKKPSGPLK
jgi:hypothetical protein